VLKRRTGDPPVLVASSRRARRELGWHPEHSKLEEMLADAWAWRLAHPRGYAPPTRSGRADEAGQVRDSETSGERVSRQASAPA
jgi:UDP-glucose 4-epimerase